MKILYGVQATGNGHISRARAMDKALKKTDVEIDYLFSGRDRDKFFDMEQFGEFACHSGLTFITNAGKINPVATLQKNKIRQLFSDINNLDLSAYDLVINDFEPISAWAARRQKVTSIAIGHQYAFLHNIPKRGANIFNEAIMKYFGPASIQLGLHWHHFGQPILPPIVDLDDHEPETQENKILVYLGFENADIVMSLLKPFSDYKFFIYSHEFPEKQDTGNMHLRPLDRDGFKKDLTSCNGVITNAGFELASEAISLGKRILVKPLLGQMEQLSNALALEQLSLGMSMDKLDADIIQEWLKNFTGKQVHYPSVPAAVAEWIYQGEWQDQTKLIKDLWDRTTSTDITNFSK